MFRDVESLNNRNVVDHRRQDSNAYCPVETH
jgi:hypothetical protein